MGLSPMLALPSTTLNKQCTGQGAVAFSRSSAGQPCQHEGYPTVKPGRVRLPIVGLSTSVRELCDALLLRALDLIEQEIPELAAEIFGTRDLAQELRRGHASVHGSQLLNFTHNEPAINIYTAGGSFEPHKDLQALTVLIPLTGGGRGLFEGGGTGFWARSCAEDITLRRLGTVQDDVNAAAPMLVLTPPAGTAMLFGGNVTHAGQEVTAGQRAVFVASFSCCSLPSSAELIDVSEDELRRLETLTLERLYGGTDA